MQLEGGGEGEGKPFLWENLQTGGLHEGPLLPTSWGSYVVEGGGHKGWPSWPLLGVVG